MDALDEDGEQQRGGVDQMGRANDEVDDKNGGVGVVEAKGTSASGSMGSQTQDGPTSCGGESEENQWKQ